MRQRADSLRRPWSRAIVTGASSGIGAALARRLADGGVDVVAIARRAAPLAALGPGVTPLPLDVDDTDALVAALRRLDSERPVDLVIANAGVGADRAHPPASYEATRAALHTNFCAAAATLTALGGRMAERRRGHLVAMSSLASFAALPASLAYSAPKAGLNMLCDCLRLDLGPSGVAVTSVYLGFVKTPMVAESTHPMPQLLSVEDAVAHVVDKLRARPETIVYPRLLGAGSWLLGALPERLRRAIFSAQPWSKA